MDDPILEYNILDAVHENEGRLTQRHISQKLGRSVSSVNFALRLLAVKGYIKISGANPRNLKYYLTPQGLIQKSILAYDFLKRQSALYEEVRNNLLEKLNDLATQSITQASVYGWTPFTEAAILYLVSSGIQVTSLYVPNLQSGMSCNRLPLKAIHDFQEDAQVLVLLEPLPEGLGEKINIPQIVGYPLP